MKKTRTKLLPFASAINQLDFLAQHQRKEERLARNGGLLNNAADTAWVASALEYAADALRREQAAYQ